jgi:TolB-like protein
MAILPFENLSKAPGAGKTLEGMVLVEFLKSTPLAIVDPGEVAAALSKERVRIATSMSKEALDAVAANLRVDLVLVGTLHDYDMQTTTGAGGSGQVPVLAMTVRILDARTGGIVWAANATRRGTDRETVFGIGRIHSLNTLAEETAADMAKAFAASFANR